MNENLPITLKETQIDPFSTDRTKLVGGRVSPQNVRKECHQTSITGVPAVRFRGV